jgi:UDP-N-acetyl-D-mannosaminuronic acid dehydrogenase
VEYLSVNVEIISKLIESAHRYLQISFAEELYLYCQANGIDFHELRDALNTKWNVNILEPREVIGKRRLQKDTKKFLQQSESTKGKILTAAIKTDEDYTTRTRCSTSEAEIGIDRNIRETDRHRRDSDR